MIFCPYKHNSFLTFLFYFIGSYNKQFSNAHIRLLPSIFLSPTIAQLRIHQLYTLYVYYIYMFSIALIFLILKALISTIVRYPGVLNTHSLESNSTALQGQPNAMLKEYTLLCMYSSQMIV